MSKETKLPEQSVVKQKVELDPQFIGKLTATLLGICAVVALLLGIVNSATEPVIRKMQEEKTAAAMALLTVRLLVSRVLCSVWSPC